MKLSEHGAELIASFEGFVPHPYQDSVGVWTIGYGSTSGVGPHTPNVTRQQALARMMREVDEEYGAAVVAVGVPLTQGEFDALVSFAYNVGTGGVGPNTGVGRCLRLRDWQGAADHLLDWDKAGGRVLPGLLRRRQAERALFLSSGGTPPAPSVDAFAAFPADEARWMHEYDHLRRAGQDAGRQRVLRSVMAGKRKSIWRIAQPLAAGGDGHGWGVNHRTERYHSLAARTR